jgi:sugar transferase EpsL
MNKRVFDLSFSISFLFLLLPLFALISYAIRISIGKPILFRQLRPGLNGKAFEIYKFRTMTDCRDESGQMLPDDQRITNLGQLLRSTSLDELPELFNVFKGEMSIVGPRPLLPQYLDLYTPEQARRHAVRPGLTGWAQVNGRNAISWEEKLRLDVWYVDHQSFKLDLKIIIKTLKMVIKREGINQAGHVTMSEFQGKKSIAV